LNLYTSMLVDSRSARPTCRLFFSSFVSLLFASQLVDSTRINGCTRSTSNSIHQVNCYR
jgi:hypothetical protein